MPRLGRQTDFTGVIDAVVVVRGRADRVSAWLEQGTVPAYVVELDAPWCAVVAAGGGHAAEPYADGAQMLVARTVPAQMRPSLGFFVQDDLAVTLVQPRRWRSLPRWFVVRRGFGPIRSALPQASVEDLLSAGHHAHAEALDRVLAQVDSDPRDILRGLMVALGVPAGHLLGMKRHADVEAHLVEPDPKAVRRFDKHTADEREERDEIEARAHDQEDHS